MKQRIPSTTGTISIYIGRKICLASYHSSIRNYCVRTLKRSVFDTEGQRETPAFQPLQLAKGLKKLHICIASQTPKCKGLVRLPTAQASGIGVGFTLYPPGSGARWRPYNPCKHIWDEILRSLKENKLRRRTRGKEKRERPLPIVVSIVQIPSEKLKASTQGRT
jgi:hypothetical protein